MLAPNTNMETDVTQTRYGEMWFYSDDSYIGASLRKYGEYSEAEVELWRKVVKPGQIVMDVGANIGALTLALADIVGKEGKVFAFEAHPDNYRLLEQNVVSHSNIVPISVAVGETTGTLKFPPLSAVNHNYGNVEATNYGANLISVSLTTLDQEASVMLPKNKVNFIKIDVEGMEADVIRGARELIDRDRPILYVENDREDKSAVLIELLVEMGYKVYHHKPSLYSNNNFLNKPVTDDYFVSVNLLCIPKERDQEFEDVTEGLRSAKIPKPVQKILTKTDWACVVRMGGIGDDLIAASTLRGLKKQGYMIEVVSSEPQCVVFENNPYVDKLTVKDNRTETPQNTADDWQKYWWSRSKEYAKFINLSHSVEVLMAQFQGSSAFWWPAEFRRKLCGQSYLEAAHDIVGVPYEFGSLFFPTQEEHEDIENFIKRHKLKNKPLIAWVISGTRIDKVYPYAGLAIARLISELDANVIMLSAPSPNRPDAGHAEQIMNHVEVTNSSTKGLYEARDVPGQHTWGIRRLLTLAMHCDTVVGPDTGIMWAVAMEKVGKVLLHSHASADNITKHWCNTVSLYANQKHVPCWPCHLLHDTKETCEEMQMRAGLKPQPDAKGAACISSIKVAPVLQAVKAVLEANPMLVSNLTGSCKAVIRYSI